MPQPRVIDTSPRDPDPTSIEKFFTRIGQEYKEREDRSNLDRILSDFDKTKDFDKVQLDLERSNLPPSRRLEAQKTLDTMRQRNTEQLKVIQEKAKAAYEAKKKEEEQSEKRQREIDETKAILRTGDYSEDEIEDLAPTISPTTARSFVSKKIGTEEGKEYHKMREKSIADYVQNAFDVGESAQDQKYVIETARKAIKGDIQGPGAMAIIKENPYGRLLVGLTPDESELIAANKKLLEGSKGIFGSKPTEREIFLLLNDMLPSIYKTQEANEAGLDFIDKVNEMKIAHSQIVDQLTEGGTKFVPDLQRKVNAAMKPLHEALLKELKEAKEKFSDQKKEGQEQGKPQEKVRVKIKGSNPPKYGRVTPYPGMEAKYDIVNE